MATSTEWALKNKVKWKVEQIAVAPETISSRYETYRRVEMTGTTMKIVLLDQNRTSDTVSEICTTTAESDRGEDRLKPDEDDEMAQEETDSTLTIFVSLFSKRSSGPRQLRRGGSDFDLNLRDLSR
jgi:hypothetical protein